MSTHFMREESMFQINQSVASRKSASALAVLAAIGASGMVAQVAAAAEIELEPTQAARGTNASYLGTGFPDNWKNWLAETGGTGIGDGQRGYATWSIDFGAGQVSSAKFRLNPINATAAYGVPAGANVNFQLISEPWSSATPDTSNSGPDVGITPGTEFVTVVAPGGDFDADITSLLVHWQNNPSAYYGVRVWVEAERGGVYAPNDTTDGNGTTANLLLEQQAVPEPASVGLLALGSVMVLRRRRNG
jgi:hypothetical protein